MSAFHRWLLKHRPYCELCTGPYPSTRIIEIDGHNRALCDAHAEAFHPLRAMHMQKHADWYKPKEKQNLNDQIRNSPNATR